MSRSSPPTTRVVEVLDLLATSRSGLSASAVARRLGISPSTCATLLGALHAARYVERAGDKTYRLGPGLLPLAEAAVERFPLLGAGHEELRGLSRELACGVTLTRIADDHLQVVAAVGTDGHMPLGVSPGDRFPLAPPYGAIAVAWRPAGEVGRWLESWPAPAAPVSPADRAHERAVMADIAACGVGVWSLESHALPVIHHIQDIIGEMGADTPSQRLREQLTALFGLFGLRGYTMAELASGRSLPVGYAIGAVFGPDARPAYEVELHLLRPSMSAASLGAMRRRLQAAAATLTAAGGGIPPARVGRAWTAAGGRSRPRIVGRAG